MKSESRIFKIRKPKTEARKKAESRSPKRRRTRLAQFGLRISLFGLLSDIGFRISDFRTACAGLLVGLTMSAFAGDEHKPQPAAPAAQPDFPLMSAARSNNAAQVKVLLAQKAPEDQRNARLETSLFIAASLGHIEVVRVLVDVPAGIDLPDLEGRTPLFAAAAAGHGDVVDLLLDNGAQPNSSRNNGESPLSVAVENKHIEVARSLLKMGALSTSYDFRGRTPLLIAREQGNTAMIELLRKANARMPDDRVPASVQAQQSKPSK